MARPEQPSEEKLQWALYGMLIALSGETNSWLNVVLFGQMDHANARWFRSGYHYMKGR